ncbi:MAG: AraC-like DNA-binding protein [Myxococcota bacterium]|jgi:AraC-like DNA-binding protein
MGLAESMDKTAKGLKDARSDGGFFFIVTDAKGVNAALMANGAARDADGKKTFRSGRGVLRDFKKEHGKCFYCQGEIIPGSTLIFNITKGTAKPTVIKRAFKGSEMLHEGVGSALIGALKGAKITMSAPEESGAPETAAATEDQAALKEWMAQPDIKRMAAELDMDESELQELFAAEQAFAAHAEALPRSIDEDTALQLQQAETEALLDALNKGIRELEALKSSDLDAALVREEQLNEQRVELARLNAIGPAPFDGDELSDTDKQALEAAVHVGLALLLGRLRKARAEIDIQVRQLDTLSPEQLTALDQDRQRLQRELDSIQHQFDATQV